MKEYKSEVDALIRFDPERVELLSDLFFNERNTK